jgi:hypothetical protein
MNSEACESPQLEINGVKVSQLCGYGQAPRVASQEVACGRWWECFTVREVERGKPTGRRRACATKAGSENHDRGRGGNKKEEEMDRERRERTVRGWLIWGWGRWLGSRVVVVGGGGG